MTCCANEHIHGMPILLFIHTRFLVPSRHQEINSKSRYPLINAVEKCQPTKMARLRHISFSFECRYKDLFLIRSSLSSFCEFARIHSTCCSLSVWFGIYWMIRTVLKDRSNWKKHQMTFWKPNYYLISEKRVSRCSSNCRDHFFFCLLNG